MLPNTNQRNILTTAPWSPAFNIPIPVSKFGAYKMVYPKPNLVDNSTFLLVPREKDLLTTNREGGVDFTRN
jgi:hypothetical protein